MKCVEGLVVRHRERHLRCQEMILCRVVSVVYGVEVGGIC